MRKQIPASADTLHARRLLVFHVTFQRVDNEVTETSTGRVWFRSGIVDFSKQRWRRRKEK